MTPDIPGASALVVWFGGWPSFHDAEVLELHLDRDGPCWLKIHAWQMTDRMDENGYYVLDKHVVITFRLEGIVELSLEDGPPGILFGLEVKPVDGGHTIMMDASYGLYGYITARQVAVTFSPGKPPVRKDL